VAGYTFTARLWAWQARTDSWVFLTVPTEVSDDIADRWVGEPRGFGSVRVEAALGSSTWRTSVFPSKEEQAYVLPVKKAVRRSEEVDTGDDVEVTLVVLDGAAPADG
jgi:hypothetical protein